MLGFADEKQVNKEFWLKMKTSKDTELTNSHEHTESTATYKTISSEGEEKKPQTTFTLLVNEKKKPHIHAGQRG